VIVKSVAKSGYHTALAIAKLLSGMALVKIADGPGIEGKTRPEGVENSPNEYDQDRLVSRIDRV
jgi:hypothetical protein